MTWGLTDAGYVAPRAADFRTIMRTRLVELLEAAGLEADVDWDKPDNIYAIVTELLTVPLGEIGEATQALYDMLDRDNATGKQLDTINGLIGVPRNQATRSTVTLRLSGTPNTFIAQGQVAQGGGDGDQARWVSTADATLSALGGTADVLFESEEYGSISAIAGAIDQIVTPVDGWASVVNLSDADEGNDIELDADYRVRGATSPAIAGQRSRPSLLAQLLDIDEVEAAVVLDNDLGTVEIVEGISMQPHSVAVVLHPNTLTSDVQAEVAGLIYQNVRDGIYTNGTDVVATVTGADGFGKTVRWDWATTLTVNVAATVTLEPGYVISDVEDPAEAAIAAYFDGLGVGEDARLLPIYATLNDIEGIKAVTALTLNGGSVDVDPLITQLCVIGTNAVST